MSGAVHICSFQAVKPVTKSTRYADLKAQVLKAGRFSVFEATANYYASKLFDRLSRDPEIVFTSLGFPWTGVRLKP